MKKLNLLAAFGLMGSLATSQAGFGLLDDFESYSTGTISNQSTSWSFDTNFVDQAVAESGGNKYLSTVGTNNAHAVFNNGSTLLADGATGTYFFRFQTPTAGSHAGTGVSARDTFLNGWNDGGAIVRLGDRSDQRPANVNKLYAYNENLGGSGSYADYGVLTTDVWYNAWVVLDNDADRKYDFYIQRDGDGTYGSQTQLGTDLAFRFDSGNTATGSIESLFFRTGLTNGGAFYDDLYFDAAGQNLVNPVPEPSTFALIGLGLAGLLIRRRR